MQLNKKIKLNQGFTLIELMIATTLFTIIMLMGVGSLVVSSNSAKASQKLRISVDNVSFAMESMTRELRMGTNYFCNTDNNFTINIGSRVQDCTSIDGGNVIEFNSPVVFDTKETHRVAYFKYKRLVDGVWNNTYSLRRCESNMTNCSDIVSPDVDVQTLKFYVNGSSPSDNIQPSVSILIKGSVKIKDISKFFTLQTMASQRSAEIGL